MGYETMKVATQSRLYRGAKLDIGGGRIRRVVREGAGLWRKETGHLTIVEVEPTVVCVGDFVIDASVVAETP